MRRCLGLSVGNDKKSDKNETGAYSLLWNGPKPRKINPRRERWING